NSAASPATTARAELEPFEPDLSPPRIDAARAEHTAVAIARLANDALENHRGRFHGAYLAGLLVNKFFYLVSYAVGAAAIGHELGLEPHAAVLVVPVQRFENFLERFDPHEIARREIELQDRCRLVLA